MMLSSQQVTAVSYVHHHSMVTYRISVLSSLWQQFVLLKKQLGLPRQPYMF
jgi:hypothetical protein